MKLQIIGDPVLHSKSPVIQGAMLRALGLDVPYTPHVVRRGELPQYLAWARDSGVSGFNATMPHKEDLLPLLDHIDPAARAMGAVNTVCLRDGKWVGFNTDGAYDAIVINPGAYTHYSYAILDALKAVDVPAYEVHISRIDRRESFRAVSVTAPACVGQIYGHGFDGYLMAMDYFLEGSR